MLNKGQKPRKKKPLASNSETGSSTALIVRKGADFDLDNEIEEAEFADSLPSDRTGFVSSRDRIRKLTSDFKSFCHCSESDKQLALLGQMQEQIKSIRGTFLGADQGLWAKFCSTVSTLLFATARKPGFLTFSSARTLTHALNLLKELIVAGPRLRGIDSSPLAALIVDHDDDGRRALAVSLLNQGLRITECDSFAQAELCLRENEFDVMLSDAELAGMDDGSNSNGSFHFVEELDLPVILLTGRADFGTTGSRPLHEGCDYIAKPIAPTEVVVKAFVFALQHRLDSEPTERTEHTEVTAPAKSGRGPEPKRVPAIPALGLTAALAELAREKELRTAAEQKLVDLREAHDKIQHELNKSSARPRQLQDRITELEQKQRDLRAELEDATHREDKSQQLNATLEQRLKTLNQNLTHSREELAEENERRVAAEHQAAQMVQSRAKLEHELSVNTAQPRKDEERAAALEKIQRSLTNELDASVRREAKLQKDLATRSQQAVEAQEHAAELEKKQHALNADLRGALQRETRLKKQVAEIEERLDSLNQALTQTRTELEQENEQRTSAEQQVTQTSRKLQEVTRKEQAARQQLEQMTKAHADELAHSRAALRQEATARQAAERAEAELSASHGRLEKKLAESANHFQKAQERIRGLEDTQKTVQTEIKELLERRRELTQQAVALDHELDNLSRSLKA